ncbi:alpha/beta hydrolase [Archaeoglobales archaeon]|nr:MAG: alpha/beta hydrolase [Archaeoglobales archaeon]
MEIVIDSIRASYDVVGERALLLCPPHPLMGGSRFDVRLERVINEVKGQNFSTLSFDYKTPFRNGIGEIEDARICVRYLKERHDFVAIFGYSFGSVIASNVADECDAAVYLSPIPKIDEVEFKDCKVPKLFIIAKNDQIVSLEDSRKLVERASNPKEIIELETDHFYFGKFDVMAESVADFLTKL